MVGFKFSFIAVMGSEFCFDGSGIGFNSQWLYWWNTIFVLVVMVGFKFCCGGSSGIQGFFGVSDPV